MTEDAAVTVATKYLQKRFNSGWKDPTHGLKLSIAPLDNQFLSDPDHPVTGNGHVVSLSVREHADQNASLWQRIRFSTLGGFGNRFKLRRFDFYVDPTAVDEKGKPLVVQLGSSGLDAWSKLRTWAKPYSALPRGELKKSLGGMAGLGVSTYLGLGVGGGHAMLAAAVGAGAAATPVAPIVGAYGIFKSAAFLSRTANSLNGKTQTAMVNEAMKWYELQEKAGRSPNMGMMYRYYSDALAHDRVGAHLAPMNGYEFAHQLRQLGL
jgi:hypothetical protein